MAHSIFELDTPAVENEQSRKIYNKSYVDQRRGVKRSDIAIGDHVLVKRKKQNKLSPQFEETPLIVVQWNRSRVTAEDSNKRCITRNVSHFKRITNPRNPADSSDSDDILDTQVAANATDEVIAQNEQQQQQQHNIPRRSARQLKPPVRFGEPIPPDKTR